MENQIKKWLGSGSINIFGLPFAGKDTQGKRLAEALGGRRLGGGEIIRNSNVPDYVMEEVNAGNLAPTKEYVEIVVPYLKHAEFTGKPLVLSAVGRWSGEEAGVMEALSESGHELKAVIHLELTEAELRKRWSRAHGTNERGERVDDAEHFIDNRLAEYRAKTVPVLETYEKMGLLEKINGHGTEDEVFDRILERLVKRARS